MEYADYGTIYTLDLGVGAAGGRVADGPRGLLARLEVSVLQNLQQRGNQIRVQHSLDLIAVAGGDVRDGPAGLLAKALL